MAEIEKTVARVAMGDLVALCVTGVAIGFIVGLSITPVLTVVLTSLLGVVAGVVAGIRADAQSDQGQRSAVTRLPLAVPVACLMSGVAVAAPLGISVRTHRLLESPIAAASGDTQKDGRVQEAIERGGLFGGQSTECAELILLARSNPDELRKNLKTSRHQALLDLERRVADQRTLGEMVEWACQSL